MDRAVERSATTSTPSGPPAASRGVDQRVLSAGTTARFWLLVVLLLAASTAAISDFFAEYANTSGNALGCVLAAGVDPDSGMNTMMMPLLAGQSALKACIAQYAPGTTPWWGVALGVGLLAGVAGAFFWGIPAWRGRRGQVTELRAMDVHGDLTPMLWELVATAGLDRVPRFVINRRMTGGAVVFGRPGRYTVSLDAGLLFRQSTDPAGFRAVVLHELAHIRNGDVTITYATIALWRAFLIVLLVPETVQVVWSLIADAHTIFGASERPVLVTNLLLFAALTVLVYLTRADILRNREIYADLDAVAWGADPRHWPDNRSTARHLFASFLELWRTHPRWDLRRRSLSDPVVLFGVQPLPVFLTGAATVILGGQIATIIQDIQGPSLVSALSPNAGALDGPAAWLTAVPITLITGVALWRAVTHAVLTGRRPPSGVRTGLWLGAGLVVGELVVGDTTETQWFPNQPEVLLVPVLVAVVITWWLAQCAELFVRGWRGRALRPAMLLGLTVPWLAFALFLRWWQVAGTLFATGPTLNFVYSQQDLQRLFPTPSTGHAGAMSALAPIDTVLSTVHANTFIWLATAMWLVPLLAWTVRPTTKVPHWVRSAVPAAADPPLPWKPLPSLRIPLRAAILGGELGAVAVVIVMAYQHTWQPPEDQRAGLYIFVYGYLLTLAFTVAAVTAAAVTAMIVRRYRLLVALAAAGMAALISFAAAFFLCATDGCLGPLNTMASTCQWRPAASWGLLAGAGQWVMPAVLGPGMFIAAVVVLLVAVVHWLATRRRPESGTKPAPAARPRWVARRVGIAVICAGAVGLAVAGTASSPGSGSVTTSNLSQAIAAVGAPPVSPQVRRVQIAYWLKYGGLAIIKRYFDDDVGKIDAVAESLDPAKIAPVCAEFSQAPRSAGAYFPVPDPTLQPRWSTLVNYVGRAGADCQRAVRRGDKNLFVSSIITLLKIEQVALPVVEAITSAGHV